MFAAGAGLDESPLPDALLLICCVRLGRFGTGVGVVAAFAFEVGVEGFTYQGEFASDSSLGPGGEVGVGGDGLLDDFIVEDNCVIKVVAHLVAVFDVFCGGVSDVFESSPGDVCVAGIDEISDCLADEFSDFIPSAVWYGCGFVFVYVVLMHSNDAKRNSTLELSILLHPGKLGG